MRFPLLLVCASLLATATVDAGAADGSVWIEGRWENTGGQYQWRQGYWQTSTTTVQVAQPTHANAPASRWIEGHWAQGANGWVWIEGHYEQVPAPVAITPPPPQVVVVQQPRPTTTVVIGGGYGYHSGYSHHASYGYGYHRPACPPVYCPPVRPVVHCPPVRPVVHCPPVRPVVHRPHVGVHVTLPRPTLPRPSIGIVEVGKHRLPVPVPVFRRR